MSIPLPPIAPDELILDLPLTQGTRLADRAAGATVLDWLLVIADERLERFAARLAAEGVPPVTSSTDLPILDEWLEAKVVAIPRDTEAIRRDAERVAAQLGLKDASALIAEISQEDLAPSTRIAVFDAALLVGSILCSELGLSWALVDRGPPYEYWPANGPMPDGIVDDSPFWNLRIGAFRIIKGNPSGLTAEFFEYQSARHRGEVTLRG